MSDRVIIGPDCLVEGAEWLRAREPRFAPALVAALPLRLKPQGFAPLLAAIVSQQVSVASANAIWARLDDAGMTTADACCDASDDTLRALGLSRPKARYAKALAAAGIPFGDLPQMPTDTVITTLTAVPGIGIWTAEIYTLFSLGRADVMAAGDLALQIAAQHLFGLPDRPTEKDFRAMAQDWSPWRSIAARALWAHYHTVKRRNGVI